MAADIKKIAKEVAAVANAAIVTIGALQTSGVLTGISPKADAIALIAISVLNAIVHAIPATLLAPDAPAATVTVTASK